MELLGEVIILREQYKLTFLGHPYKKCLFLYTVERLRKTENVYESPVVEIVEMGTGSAVLMTSLTGENINEWEDM